MYSSTSKPQKTITDTHNIQIKRMFFYRKKSVRITPSTLKRPTHTAQRNKVMNKFKNISFLFTVLFICLASAVAFAQQLSATSKSTKISGSQVSVSKNTQTANKATSTRPAAMNSAQRIFPAQENMRRTLRDQNIIEAQALKIQNQQEALKKLQTARQKAAFYNKLIQTVSAIAIGCILIFVIVRITNRKITDIKVKHLVRKNIMYAINMAMLIYIVYVWVQDVSSITIFFSVLGAGLVVVLGEPILSIAGWFIIIVRHPFDVGDRVEIGNVKGDVIDIRLFQTSLLEIDGWVEAEQSTGRIVTVPNSHIFRKETFNYNRGFNYIWNELKVSVTFESNWKKAEQIMLGFANSLSKDQENDIRKKIYEMSHHYMIHYAKLTPIVYVAIKDSGVELSLRYLTEARAMRNSNNDLSRQVLEEFAKHEDISFAYKTYRLVQ